MTAIISVEYHQESPPSEQYRGMRLNIGKKVVCHQQTEDWMEDYHAMVLYARRYYKHLPLKENQNVAQFMQFAQLKLEWE